MDQIALSTGESPAITVETVGSDLRLSGWDQSQFHAESTSQGSLHARERDGGIVLRADNDCTVHVPRRAVLKIATVGGDAKVKNVEGSISIERVGGDLTLRQVGGVSVGRVGGDLSAKKVLGSLSAEMIGGDLSARSVDGDVSAKTMADLYLRDVSGGIRATASGDVVLSVGFVVGRVYEVQASGDVVLRVPPNTSAKFVLQSAGDISVDLAAAGVEGNSLQKVVTVGEGAAQVTVKATGDVSLTTQATDPDAMGDFGDHLGREFGVMAEEFAARARAAAERAADTARRKGEAARRRAEAKIESAQRRAERMSERAERTRRKTGSFVLRFDAAHPGQPPAPPVPPVSDEERLAVLKMLEQGKITVAQAEKLLAALEGDEK